MSERKDEGTRELTIVVGVLLAAVVGVGATIWVSADPAGSDLEATAVTVAVAAPAEVRGGDEGTSNPAGPTVARVPAATPVQSRGRVVMPSPGNGPVYHADVYFDFKSTRLRADAARLLQEHAALMEAGSAWGVLIQGHADLHGPAEYNRALAQRRAEVVKRFLVELGVPESAIRVVTIGQDGALCDDATPECQQLNRRVHIEIRKLPGVAAAPVRAAVISGDIVGPAPALFTPNGGAGEMQGDAAATAAGEAADTSGRHSGGFTGRAGLAKDGAAPVPVPAGEAAAGHSVIESPASDR